MSNQDINPKNPKDALDGVIESGLKIKSWGMDFQNYELKVEFYHCKTERLPCNIPEHGCFECDACKYSECECN